MSRSTEATTGQRTPHRSHADRSDDVTDLLRAWGNGDRQALDALLPIVYGELRRTADAFLRSERSDHTLQPTALVHEAFLRLVNLDRTDWRGRRHFYSLAAAIMRRILVDYARKRAYAKRGGADRTLSLDEVAEPPAYVPENLLKVDDLLRDLARIDPEKVKLVQLRYFAGLSIEETADVLRCSRASVIRRWRLTKAWLHRELETQ